MQVSLRFHLLPHPNCTGTTDNPLYPIFSPICPPVPVAAEYLRTIFTGKIVAAGGFEPDTAETVVTKGDADLVAFGRYFVSNPDLPSRIEKRLPLSNYDRNTFYTFDARGYIDYPAYKAGALAVSSA